MNNKDLNKIADILDDIDKIDFIKVVVNDGIVNIEELHQLMKLKGVSQYEEQRINYAIKYYEMIYYFVKDIEDKILELDNLIKEIKRGKDEN